MMMMMMSPLAKAAALSRRFSSCLLGAHLPARRQVELRSCHQSSCASKGKGSCGRHRRRCFGSVWVLQRQRAVVVGEPSASAAVGKEMDRTLSLDG
jgi:hypothetical protein